jgi:hypothetical protein
MPRVFISLYGLLLAACGGQVVAIKMPDADANASASYTCVPEGKSDYECESKYSFHQYDRVVRVSKQHCAYGVSDVYVETDFRGNVTRVQYTCNTLKSGDFPTDCEGAACPPATPH